jgi:hypothetical protein
VVAGMGMLCIPFLPYLIEDYEVFAKLHLNPVLILMLYVFKSASSYWFFAYKESIVRAHQKGYILTVWGYGIYTLSAIAQIVVLVTTHNFILYTLCILVFNILRNLVYSTIANRKYPYLKRESTEKVSKEEVKDLFKDCGALMIYKMNRAVINATDTIIISIVHGLSAVGIYSNYRMLFVNLRSILNIAFNSIEASIGSIHATGKLEWKRAIFRGVNFTAVVLYGCVGIALAVVGDEFIKLWIGSDYIYNSFVFRGHAFKISMPLLLGMELFQGGQCVVMDKFRYSFGLFRQLKFRPILSMVINLLVAAVLTPVLGLAGPVIGTLIARMCTILVFDPIVIIKNELHISIRGYFMRTLLYYLVTFIAGALAFFVCSLIPGEGLIMFVVRGCTSVAVSGLVYLIAFARSQEMGILLSFLPKKIKKALKIRGI